MVLGPSLGRIVASHGAMDPWCGGPVPLFACVGSVVQSNSPRYAFQCICNFRLHCFVTAMCGSFHEKKGRVLAAVQSVASGIGVFSKKSRQCCASPSRRRRSSTSQCDCPRAGRKRCRAFRLQFSPSRMMSHDPLAIMRACSAVH